MYQRTIDLYRFSPQSGCFKPVSHPAGYKTGNFVRMTNSLPVKNLIKLNWIVAFMLAFLTFIFMLAVSKDGYNSFFRFLQTLVFMVILCFADLVLRSIFLSKNQPDGKHLKKKFYLCAYVMAILIWLLVKTIYSRITNQKWEGDGGNPLQAYSLAFLAICLLNTLILILQDLVILQHKKAQAEIENLQLKANVSETANLLLRQQIHPHFLFNALNTVKSLYKKDLQQGEDYLVHLANFLRVSISNHTTKTTLIKNELEFCLDYLKMQKIRFGAALDYSISISEAGIQSKYLPYFSLQPLVENVLKHNDLTEESPILIHIKEADGYILVSNNLQLRSYRETSTGLGLSNLAERYRLLGEEEITIDSDSAFFTVRIKILDK